MEREAKLTPEEIAELAGIHADHEDRGEFEPLMATLVEDCVYEFYPLGVQLEGADTILRYYQRVRREYTPCVQASELVELAASESAAVVEYALQLQLDGELVHERLIVVLPVQGRLFGGERIYSSERMLRLLLGEMIEETKKIPTRVG